MMHSTTLSVKGPGDACPATAHLFPTLSITLSVLQIPSLDPATHAYSFWEGVPIDAKYAFGCLFAASKTLKVMLSGSACL